MSKVGKVSQGNGDHLKKVKIISRKWRGSLIFKDSDLKKTKISLIFKDSDIFNSKDSDIFTSKDSDIFNSDIFRSSLRNLQIFTQTPSVLQIFTQTSSAPNSDIFSSCGTSEVFVLDLQKSSFWTFRCFVSETSPPRHSVIFSSCGTSDVLRFQTQTSSVPSEPRCFVWTLRTTESRSPHPYQTHPST